MKQPRHLSSATPDFASQAREQAKAYDSLFGDREIELDDGTKLSIPPHPDFGMLDDDRMADYEELQFEVESYDREDDVVVPEQTLKSGAVLPETKIAGTLKRPFRKNGELIKPPHTVRVVKAALGEIDYKRLREGGKSAGDVWRIWGKQGMEVKARQQLDPKSDGGDVDLEAVSPSDS